MPQLYQNIRLIPLAFLWIYSANAAEKNRPPPAQTQLDCIAAYLAVCGSVPLVGSAIRACVAAHKFSPECLELAKGIK